MPVRLAPGSTTAIGSLPHTDAAAAAEFAIGACDTPFWPQLPKRDFREWMVPQFASDLPGFVLYEARKSFKVERINEYIQDLTNFYERALKKDEQFPLAQSHAAGFYAFIMRMGALAQKVNKGTGVPEKRLEEAVEKQKRSSSQLGEILAEMGEITREELHAARCRFVKGHITGPLTFLLGINMDDGRPINADDELRQAAMMILTRNAAWQANMLKPFAGKGVVIFMDEPIYSALGTAAYLSVKAEDVTSTVNEVSKAVRAAGALAGVHCCGSADWETVLSTEIDVLSFDAWTYFETFEIYPEAISTFLGRGGYLAWGIVPTSADIAQVDEETVIAKLDAEVAKLVEKGISAQKLKVQSILTPSCGCGSLSLQDTEKVFRILKAASVHWRKKM